MSLVISDTKKACHFAVNPIPFAKNVLMLTGNRPVVLACPVNTFTAERCISSLIW